MASSSIWTVAAAHCLIKRRTTIPQQPKPPIIPANTSAAMNHCGAGKPTATASSAVPPTLLTMIPALTLNGRTSAPPAVANSIKISKPPSRISPIITDDHHQQHITLDARQHLLVDAGNSWLERLKVPAFQPAPSFSPQLGGMGGFNNRLVHRRSLLCHTSQASPRLVVAFGWLRPENRPVQATLRAGAV